MYQPVLALFAAKVPPPLFSVKVSYDLSAMSPERVERPATSERSSFARLHRGTQWIVAISALALGGLSLTWALPSNAPPTAVVDDAPLPLPQSGQTVVLPERDYLGRLMPRGPYVLVSLPNCDSCALKHVSTKVLSRIHRIPLVVATQDHPEKSIKALGIKTGPGLWIFQDEKGRYIGPGMLVYAPRAVLVGPDGHVERIDLDSDSIDEFISEAAR